MALTRRTFLASGSALAAAPFFHLPNRHRTLRTALIGSGWWGKNILKEAVAAGNCKVVALCDPDASAIEVSTEQVKGWNGDSPKGYADYREMLDKEKPEIVIIATPDHWHALTTIAALKAGAHVFVEKPTGHTVNESRAMLKAAKDTGKVVQVGLHRRIGPHHVSALKFLKDGNAGKIGMVRLFAHYGGGPEKASPNSPIPEGMNWDLYCGPSAVRPFSPDPSGRLAPVPGLRQRTAGRLGRPLARPGARVDRRDGAEARLLHRRPRHQGQTGPHRRRADHRRARSPGGRVRVRVVHLHLGAPPVRRQQGREAPDRRLLLRHEGARCTSAGATAGRSIPPTPSRRNSTRTRSCRSRTATT
jgi:hypothetical protein